MTTTMGRVALTVHDLDGVADFYQRAIGLHRIAADGETVTLGAGGRVLLELRRDPAARRRSKRDAGLFHTAFLLPSEADLGRWMLHAAELRAPVIGASDHAVSEAVYLTDPEGNGIEIYADRPSTAWHWEHGLVQMPSDPLDIQGLMQAGAGRAWEGFPDGSTVGHVHLQVGALAPAEAFYTALPGMAVTSRYPGGTFYAADGYHHHLATNIWNSRGAEVTPEPSTGLAEVQIVTDAAPPQVLRDPWGTAISLVQA